MARIVVASGTLLAIIGTEHTIYDTAGADQGEVYDGSIDLGNMQEGDIVKIRVFEKLLSGGTLRRTYYDIYSGNQDNETLNLSPIAYIPAKTIMKQWKLTLQQIAGIGRSFDWVILK